MFNQFFILSGKLWHFVYINKVLESESPYIYLFKLLDLWKYFIKYLKRFCFIGKVLLVEINGYQSGNQYSETKYMKFKKIAFWYVTKLLREF